MAKAIFGKDLQKALEKSGRFYSSPKGRSQSGHCTSTVRAIWLPAMAARAGHESQQKKHGQGLTLTDDYCVQVGDCTR